MSAVYFAAFAFFGKFIENHQPDGATAPFNLPNMKIHIEFLE
jgi:hypothetical protein